jgi:hypothetical protein
MLRVLDGVRGLRNAEPEGRVEERLLLGGVEGKWHDARVPWWLRCAQASVFADGGWTGERPVRDGQPFAFAGIGAGLPGLGPGCSGGLSPWRRPGT